VRRIRPRKLYIEKKSDQIVPLTKPRPLETKKLKLTVVSLRSFVQKDGEVADVEVNEVLGL
jgi:hypothetical protein